LKRQQTLVFVALKACLFSFENFAFYHRSNFNGTKECTNHAINFATIQYSRVGGCTSPVVGTMHLGCSEDLWQCHSLIPVMPGH
jgi:hypothetical protein